MEIALEQYMSLPAAAQRQVDDRIAQLLEQPEGPPEAYDEVTDQWMTTYGDGSGLLLYAVVHDHRTVLVLRLV